MQAIPRRAMGLLAMATPAWAQADYPSRPGRFIVPGPAGGAGGQGAGPTLKQAAHLEGVGDLAKIQRRHDGPDPRAAAYAPQGGGRSDYAYDRRVGRGYGDRGPSRARYRHRRARAHPVHPRPECELGLHGCLGRDGLYHGKF